jgi:hypothetical protein
VSIESKAQDDGGGISISKPWSSGEGGAGTSDLVVDDDGCFEDEPNDEPHCDISQNLDSPALLYDGVGAFLSLGGRNIF